LSKQEQQKSGSRNQEEFVDFDKNQLLYQPQNMVMLREQSLVDVEKTKG
jgi:hypothetical protein